MVVSDLVRQLGVVRSVAILNPRWLAQSVRPCSDLQLTLECNTSSHRAHRGNCSNFWYAGELVSI
jgi:hypothetical protein